mmetsp:Transcript_51087/g.84680  ORF Transcript_51087/g.84680 Transcript_51087/m.84680 type:complete len:388 (-) Transcript_51087:499-1662(-)
MMKAALLLCALPSYYAIVARHSFQPVTETLHEHQVSRLLHLLKEGVPAVMYAPHWFEQQARTLTFSSVAMHPNVTLQLRNLLWTDSIDKRKQGRTTTAYLRKRMMSSGRVGDTLADRVPTLSAATVAANARQYFDDLRDKGVFSFFIPNIKRKQARRKQRDVGESPLQQPTHLAVNCNQWCPDTSPGKYESFGLSHLPALMQESNGAIEGVPMPWSEPWSNKGGLRIGGVVWYGMSSGAIHYDNEDNVLMQMSGEKTIVVWNANATRPICKASGTAEERVPTGFSNNMRWLCDAVKREELSELLLNEAKVLNLKPGMGVVLPAGAFHSPVAMTYDSLSLSSSFWPNGVSQPRPLPSRYAMELNARLGVCQLKVRSGNNTYPDFCSVQ